MSAIVVPFPFVKRREYINRQIQNVSGYRQEAAEKYLATRIEQHEARLRKAGVAEDLIAADVEPVAGIFKVGIISLFGRKQA